MPDHVYMTFTPDQILRAKKYSGGLELQEPSRALQRTESTGSLVGLDRRWQEESCDRVSETLDEKIAYVLDNPVMIR
jgi:hypothetical protein